MKRLALLTVILLVVGMSLGFAQAFTPSISWSTAGTATLTWGINLDTRETGFTNAGSAQFSLTLVPAATLAKGAEAPVYGWIQLTTTALAVFDTGVFNAPAATAVAAKIMAPPIEIGINAAPTLTIAKTTPIENAADSVVEGTEVALAGGPAGNGTYIGYVTPAISLYGKIVSIGDWTRAQDTEMNYAVGADGTLAFAPITLGFGAYQSLVTGSVPVAYATVALAMAPLTIGAAMDLSLATPMAYDASASIAVALMAGTSLTVNFAYGNNFNGLDTKVVFATTDLVANLSETLTVFYLDVAAPDARAPEYEVINALSYKVALSAATSVTPSLTVTYGVDTETTDTILKIVAALAMALIPNTTITATYTSGDMIVVAPATPLMGTLTVAFAVAY